MPYKPPRPCAYRGCPHLVRDGRYCTDHAHLAKRWGTSQVDRPPADRRGYDRKWHALRDRFLSAYPECAKCGGIAVHVHHIVPIRDGGTNAWDNLMPLCHACHGRETVAQTAARRART